MDRFEGGGIAEEIPLFTHAAPGITKLACSAEIGACIGDSPWRPSLNSRNGIQCPALKDLSRRFLPGQSIVPRDGKALAYIKVSACVELSIKRAVYGKFEAGSKTIGSVCESMRKSVTNGEGEPMRRPLRQNRLQGVIIRNVDIRHLVYVA